VNSRKLVLFDIDGTLLRGAGPQHKEALVCGIRTAIGAECTLEDIETSGRLDRDLLILMLRNAGVGARVIRGKLSVIMEAVQHHYTVNCKADFSPHLCPGVREALELLTKRGIPMGLVTGNLSAVAWRKLENAGIDHHFSFGAFAEQATTRARLAKIAVWQAKRKGLAARKCAVTLIGDHANDIGAAQANGFRSVAVATGVMQPDQLLRFNPDVVLDTLECASEEVLFGKA
jgi:phosphoglycolate phosphatase